MVENPYFHRIPIRDSRFFFGRKEETDKTLNRVATKQPVSIVGPRRIGKTSLLFHLCDPQVKAEHKIGDDHIFVYIDCQVLSEDLSKSDVYRMLLEHTIEAATGEPNTEHAAQERMTYLDFEKGLDTVMDLGLQVIFLLDEFEAIADNRRLGEDFFNELRGLGQTGKVVYVTASSEALSDLSFRDENILSSPFFNIFSTVWLGFMEPQEARALVDGLAAMADFEGFDENDHAFLQEIAGPHPFYLQVACYCLFDEKMERTGAAAPDYDRARGEFARELRGHFEYTWKHLSNSEKRALRLVSERRLDEVIEEDMERLRQKCLVYQGETFSSVFADFVTHALESGSLGIGYVPQLTCDDVRTQDIYHGIHLAWKLCGTLAFLVLLLVALLVWQAPDFVQHSLSCIWNTLGALWNALGQIGDVGAGIILIMLIIPIVIAGIKGRKQISQMIHELWERLT